MREALLLLLPNLLLPACVDRDDDESSTYTTDGGRYVLDLVMNPDPPTTGPASLTIALGDPDGLPVPDAAIDLLPWMPEHGHGVMGEVVVSDDGQGSYSAGWDYPMSGAWELQFTIDAAAGTDTLVVDVDVE